MKVTLASSALWTHIHIREHLDNDDVALWVSRAGKDALLDIEIDILEPYCGIAFFDITNWAEQEYHIARIFKYFYSLKAGPQCWRLLSLCVLQPEPLYKLIQLLNKQPAPNLQYLYNNDEFDEERPLTKAHYRKAYLLSEQAMPNLRHAEFTHISWRYVFDWSNSLFSGLTRLQLSAGRVLASLPKIQQLLSANPTLELLQISAGYAGDYEFDRLPDDQRPSSVHLSSLKPLLIEGGDNISSVWDILSVIDAPSLERLSLANNGIDNDDIYAVNIFDCIITGKLPGGNNSTVVSPDKPLFPLLRELDIEGLLFGDQRVADLLATLPRVFHCQSTAIKPRLA